MSSYVTLIEPASGISVTGRIGPAVPKDSGGSSVTETERPGFKPLTTGDNVELIRQTFDLIIDGYPSRIIEGDVAALKRMKGRDRTTGDLSIVRVTGPASIIRQDLDWLVETLEFGDEMFLERTPSGELLRCAFTVSLVEANIPETVEFTRVKVTVYKSKKGDTLRTIAKKKLGSAKRWKILATYNGIHNPNKKLATGTTIRIPKR